MKVLLMIDCKEASDLLNEKMEQPLPFYQRLLLHVHVLLCKACAKAGRQLEGLKNAFSLAGQNEDINIAKSDECLSDECCGQMKQRIKELL